MEIRPVEERELDELVALAAACQSSPTTSIPYVADEPAAIRGDILGVDDWAQHTLVAVVGDEIVGWLLAELDDEIGRVWWWGPFVAHSEWAGVADALLLAARARLPSVITEEEALGESANVELEAWSARHGLASEASSLGLSIDHVPPGDAPPNVRPMLDRDHAAVERLVDGLFPDTHYTGRQIVSGQAGHDVLLVALHDNEVAGFAAAEIQSDGSGYIDYVGVDPSHRGGHLGSSLVRVACRALFDRKASHVHLTVRESNLAARSMYDRLGFHVDTTFRPYRRGFSLD
ncbi:MAG: GNAT family N-acetyltransferase [Actinomycetota bacterium]